MILELSATHTRLIHVKAWGGRGAFGEWKRRFVYEAYKRKRGMTLIALQPNVPDDAYMSHMKGMYVPFNMAYGSLIYY